MIAENLLEKIGFDEREIKTLNEYRKIIGNKTEPFSKAYTSGEISLNKALCEVSAFKSDELNVYTAHLIFLLDCTGYLLEKYRREKVSDEIFYHTMKDIKYKLDECLKVKGVFGNFVADWYEGFFHGGRVALGRLQYEPLVHSKDVLKIGDFSAKDGDFKVQCHIPSSGPLGSELCKESFKLAYDYFKDKLKDGILPVFCESWLLYPPYEKPFSSSKNILDFRRNFYVYETVNQDKFGDSWRVFDTDYDGNLKSLPDKTRMQKGFIDYISEEGSFGIGKGVLLFDGEKVLTRR